jgi:type 1 glutamine amidotransferase
MRILFIGILLAAGLLSESPNTSRVYSVAKRPRALALIGDRYHSPIYIRDHLAPALLRENIPVTFIENVEALNADSLRDVQLLIILRDGMNWPNGYEQGKEVKWMTDAQQQAIWDFVNNGGGFLALHNAQGIYPPGGLYYKLFGGDYGGHPPPYTFTVRIENKNHPVTAGVEDFEIFDEQHMVKYYLDREHLLMRSIAPNNDEAAAGWWREMGKGRFCYLAPGHTPEALGHPMMQRLIRNAVNWVLRTN